MPNYTLRLVNGAPTPGGLRIDFGVKTRSGHGGYPVAQVAGSDITGDGAADWRIDARGHLVPAGTYGAFKLYSRDSYSLTLASGTVVEVSMRPEMAHWREMHEAPANADTTAVFQLRTITSLAIGQLGAPVLGDHLVARDGFLNPTALGFRLRPPAGLYAAGSGPTLVIRSETIDTQRDDYGVPIRRHGCQLCSLSVDSAVAGNVYIPIDFRSLWAHVVMPYQASPEIASGAMIKYQAGGYGVSFYDMRIEDDDNPRGNRDGIIVRSGPNEGEESHAEGITSITNGKTLLLTNAPGLVGRRPIISGVHTIDQRDDVIGIGLTNVSTGAMGVELAEIEGVFTYGGNPAVGTHPDFMQHLGVKDGISQVRYGRIRRSALMMGAERALQAYFNDDTTSGALLIDAIFENLIAVTDRSQGIWLTRFGNPTVRGCSIIKALNGEIGANPTIKATSGVGGTFTHNLTTLVAPDASTQSGTTTLHHNVVLAADLSSISTALPYWTEGAEVRSPARTLRALTPDNLAVASGGVVHPDGQVSGALFPLSLPGDNNGAWNDLSEFNPDNSVWRAAHPPATL